MNVGRVVGKGNRKCGRVEGREGLRREGKGRGGAMAAACLVNINMIEDTAEATRRAGGREGE